MPCLHTFKGPFVHTTHNAHTMYTHAHMHTTCTCTTHTCTHMHACTHICTCTQNCTHTHACTCTHTCTHTCTYTHTRTHMHTVIGIVTPPIPSIPTAQIGRTGDNCLITFSYYNISVISLGNLSTIQYIVWNDIRS